MSRVWLGCGGRCRCDHRCASQADLKLLGLEHLQMQTKHALGKYSEHRALCCAASNWLVCVLLFLWARTPLPSGTAYAGNCVSLRLVLPRVQAAKTFVAIAGPVLGVIVVKVLLFGGISAHAAGISSTVSAAHQVLFSALPS